MHRRDFIRQAGAVTLAATPLMMAARAHAAGRVRITGVKRVTLKVEKDVGSYPDWVGNPRRITVGGGAITQITTDQGIAGIGPEVGADLIPPINELLVGKDPFSIDELAVQLYQIRGAGGRGHRGSAGAEIAVWDLIGKIAGQPLYKLWGGARDRVIPYSSQLRLSTPDERAEQAAKQKAQGWRAMKFRSSFPTLKEDIQLAEKVRKAVGDDWIMMYDANKATVLYDAPSKGVPWDFTRAAETALAYQSLGAYWLEEPFPRYDYAQLAELNKLITMKLAGGEGNRGIDEFKELIDRNVFDIVQPEIMLEGPGHCRKIMVLAEAAYKMCIAHQGDSRLGTICNMHIMATQSERVAPFLEIFNDTPIGGYENNFAIFENPIKLTKDGYFDMPQEPGLGMRIRQDLIQA
jgi:L-alanine-DL-glutamate epimerase-like enolase superfamily enzyme